MTRRPQMPTVDYGYPPRSAEAWITHWLATSAADGAVPVVELIGRLEARGFTAAQGFRASRLLGLEQKRIGTLLWWRLPPAAYRVATARIINALRRAYRMGRKTPRRGRG